MFRVKERCVLRVAINNGTYYDINTEMLTRHGLITGATGTGKTVTLKVLAEGLSDLGCSVFIEDVKGDLSGFTQSGELSPKFSDRLKLIGEKVPEFRSYPTVFWDLFSEEGYPIRTTVSDMGPLMLSKLLELNDVQSGIIYSLFNFADDEGLLLLDFKDLVSLIDYASLNRKELSLKYGSINTSSISAIKRKLLMLERDGFSNMFGEPSLQIGDLLRTTYEGKGIINVLNAKKLAMTPSVYSAFLLNLLSEVYEQLPEVGEVQIPKMVFFFDEAHLIFKDTPKYLLEKIEKVIKLVRSKGVSIFFITQNPKDIPDNILNQIGNKIQHALRTYTEREQKAVRAAVRSFRLNPDFDAEEVIGKLRVGEALVSFLNPDGSPQIVQRAFILPPKSKIGIVDYSYQSVSYDADYYEKNYGEVIDRKSAYEILENKRVNLEEDINKETLEEDDYDDPYKKYRNNRSRATSRSESKSKSSKSRKDSVTDRFFKSAATAIGSGIGRTLVRGILGNLMKK